VSLPQQIPIEQLEEAIQGAVDELARLNFNDPLTRCLQLITLGVGENFAAEKDSHGKRWPKRKDQKKRTDGHPLLRLALSMYGAAAEFGGPGQVQEVGARGGFVGISLDAVPYARAQNLGHSYNVNGRHWVLPPREYYYATDETLAACDDVVAQYALTHVF
jgi:hypothetical protein